MNGLIIQWGIIKPTKNKTDVSFPIAFSTDSFALVNGVKSDNSNNASYRGIAINYATSTTSSNASDSKTGFTVYNQTLSSMKWLAIGY